MLCSKVHCQTGFKSNPFFYTIACFAEMSCSAAERGGNNLNALKDFCTENGSGQGQNLSCLFQVCSRAAGFSQISGSSLQCYTGISFIRKRPPLRTYNRPMSRALWWSWGRGALLSVIEVQGCLAQKEQYLPLWPPQGPRHSPAVGYWGARFRMSEVPMYPCTGVPRS